MIHVGDCLDILPTLPERSVHCVVTSPPYFGLRSYGIGAENGEIGCEPTPDAFVAAMVRVFKEIRRVMRDDATAWLNLGDSLGPRKQELMIPHRVAMALQGDGWICRSTIIWHKPNPMPESVRDRPTKSHEYMFLLTKSPRYYFDAEAVKERADESRVGTNAAGKRVSSDDYRQAHGDVHRGFPGHIRTATRNIRSVWSIPTRSFKAAHFATFPPKLVEPCVKAGTSEKGCCPGCGKGWVRVVERGDPVRIGGNAGVSMGHADGPMARGGKGQWDEGHMPMVRPSITTGWRPGCTCGTERPIPEADLEADPTLIDDFEIEPFPPIPCTVLDPFSGAGTVGLVAKQLGRSFVGCELNAEYAAMAEARIAKGA